VLEEREMESGIGGKGEERMEKHKRPK